MTRNALGRGLGALIREPEPQVAPPPAPVAAGAATAPARETMSAGPQQVDIDLIDPSPYQPRTKFREEALDELARSIMASGIIQPLVLRPIGSRVRPADGGVSSYARSCGRANRQGQSHRGERSSPPETGTKYPGVDRGRQAQRGARARPTGRRRRKAPHALCASGFAGWTDGSSDRAPGRTARADWHRRGERAAGCKHSRRT